MYDFLRVLWHSDRVNAYKIKFTMCLKEKFLKNYVINLFLTVLGLRSYVGFSLVVASGGYSSFTVCRLLIAVVSLVVEHRL